MLYWPTKVSQHRVEQDTTIHRGYCWRYKTSYEGSKRLKRNGQNTRRNSKEIKAINKTYWNKTTSCLEEQTNQKKLTYKYMQAKVINIKMRAVDGLLFLRASVMLSDSWLLIIKRKKQQPYPVRALSIRPTVILISNPVYDGGMTQQFPQKDQPKVKEHQKPGLQAPASIIKEGMRKKERKEKGNCLKR